MSPTITNHEKPNDTLRLGREMRLPIRWHPRALLRNAIAREHRAQRESREAHAAVGQEISATDAPATIEPIRAHRIVTKSL